MSSRYFSKIYNFWLHQRNPSSKLYSNIYRVGLFPQSFHFDFESQHISHIYLDHRLKRKTIKEDVHIGTILYNGYIPLHLMTPFPGKITNFNYSIPYSYYFGYELIKKDNWLFEMEIIDYYHDDDKPGVGYF
tara:strand:+ start:1113 stop:1508 length:396 start_codon:yes stop_codon:yes gene_type:complete